MPGWEMSRLGIQMRHQDEHEQRVAAREARAARGRRRRPFQRSPLVAQVREAVLFSRTNMVDLTGVVK
jgi:hypothetical protein